MNSRNGELNPKILQHSAAFFPAFRLHNYAAALNIERKMSHLNIASDRYNCNVMHYILVICLRYHRQKWP